jgi:hypothetical protein
MLHKKYQQVNSALHRTSHHVVAAAYGLHALVRDSRCVQMSFAASTVARADGITPAQKKRGAAAVSAATANTSVAGTLRHRIGASIEAVSTATVTTRSNPRRSAAAVAQAVPSFVIAGTKLLQPAAPQTASAVPSEIVGRQFMYLGASSLAAANNDVSASYRFRLLAAATAEAVASSGAEDYGSAAKAPIERVMIVPASDRRMEVPL